MTSKTDLKINLAGSEQRIETLQRLVRERDALVETIQAEGAPAEKTFMIFLSQDVGIQVKGTETVIRHDEALCIIRKERSYKSGVTVAIFPRGNYTACVELDSLIDPPTEPAKK